MIGTYFNAGDGTCMVVLSREYFCIQQYLVHLVHERCLTDPEFLSRHLSELETKCCPMTEQQLDMHIEELPKLRRVKFLFTSAAAAWNSMQATQKILGYAPLWINPEENYMVNEKLAYPGHKILKICQDIQGGLSALEVQIADFLNPKT